MRTPLITVLTIMCATAAIAQDRPVVKPDPDASRAARTDFSAAAHATTSSASGDTSAPRTSIPMEKPVFANPETVTIATWDNGSLTNTEVSATLATRRPAHMRIMAPNQLAGLPRPQQVETVKQIAYEKILLAEARKNGIDKDDPQVARAIAEQDESILNRLYYTEKVEPRMNQLLEEAAKKRYEENKDQFFTRPAVDVLRALHISTYEMVTAEEGDTLESIASAVTGSAGAASEIRSASPPYLMRKLPTQIEDKVLSSPLEGGEILYVPMNEDALASATAYAETLRKQLLDGKSIMAVADTASGDFTVSATENIRIEPGLPYYDSLVAAAQALDTKSSISAVIKTPTGLNILTLQDRETTQVASFEDVKDRLLQEVSTDPQTQRAAVEDTRDRTLAQLFEKYNVVINDEAISRPNYQGTDPLTTDTVIAQAGDFKYTLPTYLAELRLTGKDWGQLTKQERLDIIKISPTLTRHLVAVDARALGMDKSEEYREMMDGVLESIIVARYKQTKATPEDNRVTEDELRAFYNDNLDNYTSPAQVTLREISKRINIAVPPAQKAEDIEKARKSLEEIRSRIKSQEDFIQLARRESEAISTRSRGGLIGTVNDNFRGEAFKNQLRQLQPGDVSEPFLYGSEVMIIRMDERTAPTVQPFENVRRQVMRDYARKVPQSKQQSERDKTLEAANFKLLF